MTQTPSDPAAESDSTRLLPTARARHSRWLGVVWALPLAAMLVVAFLGIRAFAERGIDIVVTFGTAAGARVNDTKVIYKGLEVGVVRHIDISDDGLRVDMTLRVDRRSKPWLTTQTTFWLVGASPDITNLASVKAAVAGLSIGVAPSLEGEATRTFRGLDEPPLIAPGTTGTRYTLATTELGSARVGSSIYFRGQQIGRIVTVRFVAPDRFELGAFIEAPYDKLVQARSMFWISSPVKVEFTGRGVSAALEHAGSLINGAIELDLAPSSEPVAQQPAPPQAQGHPQSPAGAEFHLYPSRRAAEAGASGPALPYRFVFKGAAGELLAGAPVRLLGFTVGEIQSVQLRFDPQSGDTASEVQAVLFPTQLHLPGSSAQDDAGLRTRADAALNRLLARGFRARLSQSPPLIGSRLISLEVVAGAGQARLSGATDRPLIPTDDADTGTSIDGLIAQVNQLLKTINGIPLQAIGQDVRQLTQRLSTLAASPAIARGLQHFEQTMAQADQLMAEVTPRVGPLVDKLNRAADELTSTVSAARNLLGGADGGAGANAGAGNGAGASGTGGIGSTGIDATVPQTLDQLGAAARSIRTLADYLGRHPEALLRGRGNRAPSAPTGGPAHELKEQR